MKRFFCIPMMIVSFCLIIQYSHAGAPSEQINNQLQQTLSSSANANELPESVPGELLIKFKSDISIQSVQDFAAANNLRRVKEYPQIGVALYSNNGVIGIQSLCTQLNNNSLVDYAEPNFIVHADLTPNDPSFSSLWGMHNIGQTGGTADADIDAPEAWDIETGSSTVVVGVIDTGVDYNHPDLINRMWTNPGEIPGNGVDDDGNGYIDDIHGWDFANDDNNPMDGHGHGTHVSGTIGAEGDNSTGVVGVNWNVRIMALKFLDDSGSGNTADAIPAILYALANGADLTNNSWGGGGFSQALKDAIDSSPVKLFVAAAGNDGTDNDQSPHYPSSYESANILSVASTDRNDDMSSFSNYGLTSVDVGAPGSDIYSCEPGNSYGYNSGTSMASPHVAGAAALLLADNPGLSAQDLKTNLMHSTDQISALNLRTVTGGRLNVHKALTGPYPPIANFEADITSGTPPFDVTFTNHSLARGTTTWGWDFGDGGTSTDENPTHSYDGEGPFTVSLTVTDSYGSDIETKTGYISGGDLINDGSFENGPPPASAWTMGADPVGCDGLWILDPSSFIAPAYDGTYAYWGGGYCSGIPSSDYVEQSITIPAGATNLKFMMNFYRTEVDDVGFEDYAYVIINGAIVNTYDLIQANNTHPDWAEQSIDISAYAGQTVTLRFEVASVGSETGNVLIDYITIDSPSYGDELAVDIGGLGLWDWDGTSWTGIYGGDAQGLASWSNGLAVDLGGSGLWNWNGTTWTLLYGGDVQGSASWSNGLAVDIGSSGLWNWDGTTWTLLYGGNVEDMTGWSNGIALDIGVSGFWNWDGTTWTLLYGGNVQGSASWSNGIAVDIGGSGLWNWDGTTWTLLYGGDVQGSAGWSNGIAVDIGVSGLWNWDGTTWTLLYGGNVENMTGWSNGIAVDIGGSGLWNWDGTSWTLIYGGDVENIEDVDLY